MTSSYTLGVPQIDKRIWVSETLRLDNGTEYQFLYLADPKADFNSILQSHQTLIQAQIQQDTQDEQDDQIKQDAIEQVWQLGLDAASAEVLDAVSELSVPQVDDLK